MSQTFGRTRWKRFAIVMVPTIAATAAVGVSIAQGALAASFSVSGQQFKVSAGKLVGQGFTQYGTVLSHDTSQATNANTAVPVAVSGFTSATINQLCQSVDFPTPFGSYTLTINAGGSYDPTTDTSTGPEVDASQLFISMSDLKADKATFNGINIGVATGALGGAGTHNGDATNPGAFAQEADSATLIGVQQTAWATSASTFSLNGLHMSLASGSKGCF
ncbi:MULTISPECIES: DUF6230 family protein [Streptacidiphilus]|uniref:DUF6230 family protein n=1 Tax=Streptacidiphilus cavernicola TaxID=3342716 RepID=A0ABV6UVB3_9ACTN|nr:DUF6230 family protein [Streptacidiphilus jeojiense]